jgi:anti-sigma factor (TIGR02949 family)
MACDLSQNILHAYFDGELDAARAAEFERHLEQCPECVDALDLLQRQRSNLQSASLREKAPAELRQKIRADLKLVTPIASLPRGNTWRWLAIAASVLLLGYIGWRTLSGLQTGGSDATLSAEIVDAHLRSLQPGHLVDVVSTDQHTVKPWFDGKLDFAPPVRDFSETGFPLRGARLDVIQGRTVAALVYGRRKHFINVFLWPSTVAPSTQVSEGARQGYNWIHWHSGPFEAYAVSDAAPQDLQELRQLFP